MHEKTHGDLNTRTAHPEMSLMNYCNDWTFVNQRTTELLEKMYFFVAFERGLGDRQRTFGKKVRLVRILVAWWQCVSGIRAATRCSSRRNARGSSPLNGRRGQGLTMLLGIPENIVVLSSIRINYRTYARNNDENVTETSIKLLDKLN